MTKSSLATERPKLATLLSLGAALATVLLSISVPLTSAKSNAVHHERDRVIASQPGYEFYDSLEFESPELSASAVSPFCRSFAFLCHVRCMQRGDSRNAGNININVLDGVHAGEINRCSHVPNTNTNRVLCMCNNGVDLTAEIDYALEGVVDIAAAGGDDEGTGTGEAGKIREMVFAGTKTIETPVYKTITSTATKTMTKTVTTTVSCTPETPLALPTPIDESGSGVAKKSSKEGGPPAIVEDADATSENYEDEDDDDEDEDDDEVEGMDVDGDDYDDGYSDYGDDNSAEIEEENAVDGEDSIWADLDLDAMLQATKAEDNFGMLNFQRQKYVHKSEPREGMFPQFRGLQDNTDEEDGAD
ncbi:hypothetical protein BG004_006943 [Podila humilis]|nr:hypothetical protein BG004_006943 [Podila humilis]